MLGNPALLEGENYQITSGQTNLYNCLSWAVGVSNRWIWPDEYETGAWPPQLPRNETLENFRRFFELCGFVNCENGDLNCQLEKIAIYTDDDNNVCHVARQLQDGKWTSKLGVSVDISHLTDLLICGRKYPYVSAYMARALTGEPPRLPDLAPPPAIIHW